jgi:hypothetical protein
MENMAFEISKDGVRVVCLRTTANIDTTQIQARIGGAVRAGGTREDAIARIANLNANLNFKRGPATTSDTAKLAAILRSTTDISSVPRRRRRCRT